VPAVPKLLQMPAGQVSTFVSARRFDAARQVPVVAQSWAVVQARGFLPAGRLALAAASWLW